MTDLKYKTAEELQTEKINCESYISRLSTQLSGQRERLKWIEKYLFEKTPQEITFSEIERRLGHKVIIKE